MNFKEIFERHIESNKRAWSHDRTKTIGASESFACLRRNYFTKNEFDPDKGYEQSFGATERGNLLEAHYVVPAVRSGLPENVEALWMGEDQTTLIDGRLSATPDGLLTGLARDCFDHYGIPDSVTGEVLLEIKSVDPRVTLNDAKPLHVGQAQQQMGLVWATTNFRPHYALILYVDASFIDNIYVFPVARDPAIYEAAKKRADQVYDATDPSQLPPEGKIKGGSECAYCPFQSRCHAVQIGSAPPAGTKAKSMSDDAEDQLRTLAKRYADIKAKLKEIEAFEAETKESIKDFLRRMGNRFAKTSDGYSASLSIQAGRKSYDLERIAEDTGINLEDYVKEGPEIEKLVVKGAKGGTTE